MRRWFHDINIVLAGELLRRRWPLRLTKPNRNVVISIAKAYIIRSIAAAVALPCQER